MSVTPKKELGQHFLGDENILGVIGRLAALARDDVVLEVGPGLGVLTAYLADRVKLVHAIELDTSLESRLRERLDGRDNVELVFGDALAADLARLEPPATKLVSNLPYSIATPLVIETLDGLPSVELWCVMVQREVADRFFAAPRTKTYGAVSVLVQLAARRTGFHPVSPSVFRPRPNVDSALVAFRRVELPPRFAEIKRIVTAAFAHRRKTLPNSLALSGVASRQKAVEALAAIGHAPLVGRPRDDGLHDLTTVYQRLDLCDRVSVEPAPALAVTGFAGDTLVRRALLALADAAATAPRWRVRLAKRIPVAAGLGGGSSDAATALRLANASLDRPLPRSRLHALARELGSDVPFFLEPGPQLGEGTGTRLAPLELPQDYWVVLLEPNGARKESTAVVYAAFDARDGGKGYRNRRAAFRRTLATVRRPVDLAGLPPNDLASSPLADELRWRGAFRADLSGAGPVVYGLFQHGDVARAARRAVRRHGRTWLTVPTWYG